MAASNKTVLYVIQSGATFLEAKGIEQPRLACELLVARLFECERMELYVRFENELSELQLAAMRRGIKRVGDGEPIQYVTGEAGFMGHIFRSDKRALIPRPETEGLVERLLDTDALWSGQAAEGLGPFIVDVGTGSGCIVVSLAAARPEARYLGLDVSPDALALAGENAARIAPEANIAFAQAELSDLVEPESVDAIVANLPYIPSATCDALPVHIRDHEPRLALDGGPDGLSIVRIVVEEALVALRAGGMLFLEIGDDQGPAVKTMLTEAGFGSVEVHVDLNRRDRIVTGTME